MRHKVLEIIIDGYGFNPDLEIEILKEAYDKLPKQLLERYIQKIHGNRLGDNEISPETTFIFRFNRNPLNLYFEQRYQILKNLKTVNWKDHMIPFSLGEHMNSGLIRTIKQHIREISAYKNYAVWAAQTDNIDKLRCQFPSFATKTSGIEIGYEDLRPEVQGNSETGHQQLGNMTVASQIPLDISIDIQSGKFVDNPLLNQSVEKALEKKVCLNVTFMISGEYGDDGRVHSCWNHLESYLKIVFLKYKFNPERFRLQAILDGRDAPLTSSVEVNGNKFGFLQKLYDMFSQYDAEDCISWIIGRGIAMDRDYEEDRTRKDYEMLVYGKGIVAENFNDAVNIVRNFHDNKIFDPFVEPILIVGKDGKPRTLGKGDIFVDLNFRADRQRARIACLIGAKEFIQKEAGKKGKKWSLKWIDDDLQLEIFCLTEYHPEFEKHGAKIVYPIKSHPHNFLSLFTKFFHKQRIPFKYLLIAESNKAVHMGYFIRGRRENIEVEQSENRYIIPSYAEEDGITTDDDFYKTPQMKAFEVCGKLLNELSSGIYDMAVVNLSNPDMLGHLINNHFDANVRALEIIDYVISTIVDFLLIEGFHIIITSDHGNIDDFSASHSLNDVMTTFISPDQDIEPKIDVSERIRLFDIPWAIAEIMGISKEIEMELPPIDDWIKEKGLSGRSPIALRGT